MKYLSQLINYGISEYRQTKPGLDRISNLLQLLGNPQHLQKYILVGGTNGKGSVAHLVAHLLQHQYGLKVGLFTSPHLNKINERFMINREPILDTDLENVLGQIANACRTPLQEQGTFFEITTAIAIQYFAQEKTDINVLEVGLGGRYDATNIVDPLASIVVSIGHDHMEILGDTLEKVAYEKMGIFRKGGINIVGQLDAPVKMYMQHNCEYALQFYEEFKDKILLPKDLSPFFNSEHQRHNLKLALRVVELVGAGFKPALDVVGQNSSPLSDFYIPGRTEIRGNLIIDGAHNPEAAMALREFLEKNYPEQKFVFVMGMASSKDPVTVLQILLPLMSQLHLCEFAHDRSIKIDEWQKIIHKLSELSPLADFPIKYWTDITSPWQSMNHQKHVVITGSFLLFSGLKF